MGTYHPSCHFLVSHVLHERVKPHIRHSREKSLAQSGNPDLQWLKRKGLLSTSFWFILNCRKNKHLTIRRKPPPSHLRIHWGVRVLSWPALACKAAPPPSFGKALLCSPRCLFVSQNPQVLGFTSVRHPYPHLPIFIFLYILQH